ncbi:MAG: DUF3302 domain-containing protein [Terrimicrobiaceae bacterium]|nr:DUF3302 domain-containing protein [Terrimicrobiaceae bacterium]
MDFLSYFALGLIFFVLLSLAYGMIAIHDIPYHIAKKRDHPHQDAIHAGGWVSLFTLHAIWPFLWIWAMAYHPVHGYSGRPRKESDETKPGAETNAADRMATLEARIAELEKSGGESRK